MESTLRSAYKGCFVKLLIDHYRKSEILPTISTMYLPMCPPGTNRPNTLSMVYKGQREIGLVLATNFFGQNK